MSYNFAQYVGFYVPGKDLVLRLTRSWSTVKGKKGTTLVIVTQPGMSRNAHMDEKPAVVTIEAQDQETIAAILAVNSATATAHRAKFDEQAATRKHERAASKALDAIAAFLAE